MEGSLQIGIQSHPPPSIGNAHPDTPSRLNGRRRNSHGGGVPPMETLTSSGGLTSHTLTTQEPAVYSTMSSVAVQAGILAGVNTYSSHRRREPQRTTG